jgi:hypothetical protein
VFSRRFCPRFPEVGVVFPGRQRGVCALQSPCWPDFVKQEPAGDPGGGGGSSQVLSGWVEPLREPLREWSPDLLCSHASRGTFFRFRDPELLPRVPPGCRDLFGKLAKCIAVVLILIVA